MNLQSILRIPKRTTRRTRNTSRRLITSRSVITSRPKIKNAKRRIIIRRPQTRSRIIISTPQSTGWRNFLLSPLKRRAHQPFRATIDAKDVDESISSNIQTYTYLLKDKAFFQKDKTKKNLWIKSLIRRREFNVDIFAFRSQKKNARLKDRTRGDLKLISRGRLVVEIPHVPKKSKTKLNGKFLMYQTIAILLVHKTKQQINQGCGEKSYINKENLFKSIERLKSLIGFRKKKDFLVPENLLSTRSRRELRILLSFNSKKKMIFI